MDKIENEGKEISIDDVIKDMEDKLENNGKLMKVLERDSKILEERIKKMRKIKEEFEKEGGEKSD